MAFCILSKLIQILMLLMEEPNGTGFCLLSFAVFLQAYSVYDEEIGYCQGQSFLAAVLLLHVSKLIPSAVHCTADDPTHQLALFAKHMLVLKLVVHLQKNLPSVFLPGFQNKSFLSLLKCNLDSPTLSADGTQTNDQG